VIVLWRVAKLGQTHHKSRFCPPLSFFRPFRTPRGVWDAPPLSFLILRARGPRALSVAREIFLRHTSTVTAPLFHASGFISPSCGVPRDRAHLIHHLSRAPPNSHHQSGIILKDSSIINHQSSIRSQESGIRNQESMISVIFRLCRFALFAFCDGDRRLIVVSVF